MADIIDRRTREQSQARLAPLQGISDEELDKLIQEKQQQEALQGIGGLAQQAGGTFLGLAGAEQQKGPSAIDELAKLQALQMKEASEERKSRLDELKIQKAEREFETGGDVIAQLDKQPPIEEQDITAGGTPTAAVKTDKPTPVKPTTQQEPVVAQQEIDFNTLPSGEKPTQPLAQPQVTGFPSLDSLVQEIGNIPLTLDSTRETIDNTGKRSVSKTKSINPLVTKFLEAKLSRQGKLDDARFRVLVAGRRWGKTWLAVSFLMVEALTAYDRKVWYVAPWYRQAKDVAWKMLKKMCPDGLKDKVNETELTITLINGSEISLKGADNPDSLLGVGLHAVVLDEYASMKSDVWQEIIRPMLTDTQGKALFIGTPKGKNHFWELFCYGLKGKYGYKSFQFRTIDSPMIPEAEIVSAREQLNDKFFRQEYEASFEDFTGLVYPEFSEKIHVTDKLPDLRGLSSVVAIDPALSGVHAWLECHVNTEDVIMVTKEYYEKNKRVSEVAGTLPEADMFLIDPSGYNKSYVRDGSLYSMADEYREYGISVTPGENDVDSGINRVGEMFKRKKILIHSSCKNLISEINKYHWSENRETVRGESKARPYKKDDHLADCLRYIVQSRYKTVIMNKVEKPHKMSVEYELQKAAKGDNWKDKWKTSWTYN